MELEWSYSTHKLYRFCPRKFFFTKIAASWNSSDQMRQRAHELKQLQTLSLVVGDVVHRVIQRYVQGWKTRKVDSSGHLVEDALNLFRERLRFSEERLYKSTPRSHAGERFCALWEHESEKGVGQDEVEQATETIKKSLTNFFSVAIETRKGQQRIVELLKSASHIESEFDGFNFQYEGVLVRMKVDLALLFRSRTKSQVVLIDWKLEKNEHSNNEIQLLLYGYGCMKRWGISDLKPEDIVLLEVNLLNASVKRYQFSPEHLAKADDLLFESISELKRIMVDREYADFRLTEFPLTQNSHSCAICTMGEVCLANLQQEEVQHATELLELF